VSLFSLLIGTESSNAHPTLSVQYYQERLGSRVEWNSVQRKPHSNTRHVLPPTLSTAVLALGVIPVYFFPATDKVAIVVACTKANKTINSKERLFSS
jgi:hypothetical protein